MPEQPTNPVQSLLDPLPVGQDFKATIWDSYYGANSPQEFRQRFDQMAIPDDVKAKLWDLKFGQGGTPNQMPQPGQRAAQTHGRLASMGVATAEQISPNFAAIPAMIASPLAARAGAGLLTRMLITGLAGGFGEGAHIAGQRATGSPNGPQSLQDALLRIGVAGTTQGGIEGVAGLAAKPLEALSTGVIPPSDRLSQQIARINSQYGLRLTAPEVSQGPLGKLLQRVGTSGLFGQAPATVAQREGLGSASRLLEQELNLIAPQTTPQATGQAVQATIGQNAKVVGRVLGGNLQQAGAALKDTPINVAPLKQWAQQELERAGTVDQFLAGNAGAAQFKNLPDTPANQGLLAAIRQQSLDSGKHATDVLGRPDQTVEGVLRDILKMPDEVPFNVANKLKQDLFSLNPTLPSAFKDEATAVAKTANHHLTGLMDQAVGGMPEGQAWIAARGDFRTARQLFQKSENQPYRGQLVQQLLSSAPEDIVGKVKTVSDVEAVRDAVLKYGQLGSPSEALQSRGAWGQFQRQYVQGLLKDPEALGLGTDLYGLKGRMDKAGGETLSALFSNNPQALNNLKAVAETMARVQKMGNVNTLGVTIAIHGVANAALAAAGVSHQIAPMTAVGGMAAFESVPWVVSRVIYNQRATALFLHGLSGLMAESARPSVAFAGRMGQAATPYAGPALADIARAFQIVAAQPQEGPTPSRQLPQPATRP